MSKQKFKAQWATKRRWLVLIYGSLIVLGFGLGRVASAAPDKGETPQEKVVKKVIKAIEQVARDAEEQTDDAGPKKAPPAREGVVGFEPSPEPEVPDGGLPEHRRLPESDAKGGVGKAVVIVKVEDTIDMGLSAFIERSIDDNPDAAALILDINTPGGRVDAATEIRDAIMDAPKTMRTVAFIHPRAISAGAFISFACDLIFIADGGSMGAATPISIGGSGEAEPVDEKMVSYFRTEMATTARAKGRRGDIAEAMVDYEVEIEGITTAGKLLTLDTAGALRWKIADAVANSMDEVLELLALGGAEQRNLKPNWAEEVARILTHPILSGLLMSIGVLGILIELYQPGFGLPGIVGISCLVIFFAGHLVVNLAGWEEVLLFVVGIGLLGVEVFVTPGFGVLGGLGVIGIVMSLVLAMISLPIDVSFNTGYLGVAISRVFISLMATFVAFFGVILLLPRTKFFQKSIFVLRSAITDTASGGVEGAVVEKVLASGISGVAESFLRPAGIARFGDKRVDVLSEGDFIEQGERVVIVRTEGNRVVVKKE
ncbi:MAG: nodulation protein NfeD [Deltaproteobacteria bacterium]|nr:nodulation protein NfeD [Deltaproteobacteria bacterium]